MFSFVDGARLNDQSERTRLRRLLCSCPATASTTLQHQLMADFRTMFRPIKTSTSLVMTENAVTHPLAHSFTCSSRNGTKTAARTMSENDSVFRKLEVEDTCRGEGGGGLPPATSHICNNPLETKEKEKIPPGRKQTSLEKQPRRAPDDKDTMWPSCPTSTYDITAPRCFAVPSCSQQRGTGWKQQPKE